MATNNAINTGKPIEVSNGGTGKSSTTAYSLVCGGTSSTSALQAVATLGSSGEILTSNGAGMLPTWQSGLSSITITGDSGSATNPITLTGGTSGAVFTGATHTMTESFNYLNIPKDSTTTTGFIKMGDPAMFNDEVVFHRAGSINCTFVGGSSGASTLIAGAGANSANTFLGSFSGKTLTTGSYNTGVGLSAGKLITSGIQNTSIGAGALEQLQTGDNNVGIGICGASYTTSESNNIIINSSGVAADANTLRIGEATGSNPFYLNKAYICGITGINVGSTSQIVTMGTAGTANQLGTAILTSGTGVTVSNGANTITISSSGVSVLNIISTSTTPYDALTTDYAIAMDSSGGVKTVRLPNAPATGRMFVIKDSTGSAAANNITVTTVGGAVNIDGAVTYVMNSAYQSVSVIFTGSVYLIV